MSTATRIWTEKYAEMCHGKTRYFEAGTGYPTILIHGAGCRGADGWLLIIGPLAERYRVLSIDCLNWGPGDVFDQELSFAYLVDHVREFMDVMGIEKANIVGHSMGGWIVNLLAYESPDRVNKLVLVAAGGTPTRPLQNMVEFKVPSEEQIRAASAGAQNRRQASTPTTCCRPTRQGGRPGHGEAFAKVMKHMTNPMTRPRYNTVRRLPHIKVPTLILWGTDDQVNALEMGEASANAIPSTKLVVYDGVGHPAPQKSLNDSIAT